MSSRWEGITGDSFVVDVSAVRHKAKTAKYMEKYLRKGFKDRGVLEALGYSRRWSCSRNWPRGHALRLRGSEEESWKEVIRVGVQDTVDYRHKVNAVVGEDKDGDCPSVEQVGTDLALELFGTSRSNALIRRVKGVVGENP